MVKCTRSTEASDFSRLRQTRSPACGSPETSSTRSRSRTPLICTTAALLRSVNLAVHRGDAELQHVHPAMRQGDRQVQVLAHRHGIGLRLVGIDGDRQVDLGPGDGGRCARHPRPAASGVNSSPMMAKAGALLTIRRRSQSVWRAGQQHLQRRGQVRAPAPVSCTRPSVIRIAPATRARGSSASASASAVIDQRARVFRAVADAVDAQFGVRASRPPRPATARHGRLGLRGAVAQAPGWRCHRRSG